MDNVNAWAVVKNGIDEIFLEDIYSEEEDAENQKRLYRECCFLCRESGHKVIQVTITPTISPLEGKE